MFRMTKASLAIAIVLALAAGPVLALTHTVVKGDTLSGISKKYYGSMQYWPELQRYNNISNANLIYDGNKVNIPGVEVMQAMAKATTTTEKMSVANAAKANGGTLAPPSTTPNPNTGSGYPASVPTNLCTKCNKRWPTKDTDASTYNTTVFRTHILSCGGGQSLPLEPITPSNPHGSNYDALKGLDTDK